MESNLAVSKIKLHVVFDLVVLLVILLELYTHRNKGAYKDYVQDTHHGIVYIQQRKTLGGQRLNEFYPLI